MVVGNGLAGTLIGVRAGLEGMRVENIGLLMSAYWVGYAAGSYLSPRVINAVGHIRTFAALASIGSAIALAYAIVVSPLAWDLLRVAHGVAYAGLVVVIESWLNGSTTPPHRGRVLAIYSVILMAASAASQPLLIVAAPSGFVLFCIVSICFSLALVPITLTRAGVPGVAEASRAGLRRLYERSPTGLAGTFATGLAVGAFYGMGPTFSQRIGLHDAGIAWFMGVTILGALVFQWPLGWLSDVVDRRHVIVALAGTGAIVAGAVAITGPTISLAQLLGLTFLYGGMTMPLYALSIAHVNDYVDPRELVATASGLVLVYGGGAVIGPFGASLVMAQLGADGLFVFSGAVLALFAAFALLRIPQRAAIEAALKRAFVNVPRTTHAVLQIHKHRAGPRPGPRAPD
jgi:MFS family permease